jgi:hypothetical protein
MITPFLVRHIGGLHFHGARHVVAGHSTVSEKYFQCNQTFPMTNVLPFVPLTRPEPQDVRADLYKALATGTALIVKKTEALMPPHDLIVAQCVNRDDRLRLQCRN